MEIVINIDENVFTRLFDNGTEDYAIVNDDLFAIAKSIRNGKPLKQQRWIPVSEKLPMNGDACCDNDVLVSCEDGFVRIGFCMGYDELGNREWCISADKYAEVIAWMPLPPSYQGESEEEE